jgi:acyl-coenzyme A synthetase/AMP-(fatty) acid ligase
MWLWEAVSSISHPGARLFARISTVSLADLRSGSCLGPELERLRGRCVLLDIREQLAAALALIELDGVAKRMVLCTPDLPRRHLPDIVRAAAVDACVLRAGWEDCDALGEGAVRLEVSGGLTKLPPERVRSHSTQWILLTSGTSGAPKLVRHSLESLLNAIIAQAAPKGPVVWGTFYDIRRYGGLQILLRALLQGSLVLSDASEPVGDFLGRLAESGVTHLSGTPTHWRRALMSGAAKLIDPAYVRLSGEIADQAILDAMQSAFPRAVVAHAFASTEAGVGFEVEDGRAGFPASFVPRSPQGVEIEVGSGTLRLRSAGNAYEYLGEGAPALRDPEGYVNTLDRLELRDERYVFTGRVGGMINVGGLKVHPEEVESVINLHPRVRMSRVRARRNPITGAIVTAEVVLVAAAEAQGAGEIEREIIELCRSRLPGHKVPVSVRCVPSLEVTAAGKLVRSDA